MNRRDFLASLAAIPLVGKLLPQAAAKPDPWARATRLGPVPFDDTAFMETATYELAHLPPLESHAVHVRAHARALADIQRKHALSRAEGGEETR